MVKLLKKTDQGQEICRPEVRSSPCNDEKGIGSFHICAGGGQRTNPLLARYSEKHPMLTPGMGIADQLELLAAQRVEGVSDSECSYRLNTICS